MCIAQVQLGIPTATAPLLMHRTADGVPVLRTRPPTRQTRTEIQIPGFSLACPQLSQAFEKLTSGWRMGHSLCFSNKYMNKYMCYKLFFSEGKCLAWQLKHRLGHPHATLEHPGLISDSSS